MNNLPGFTAEASIGKSATNFAGDLVWPDAAAVVPQGCTSHTVSDGLEIIKYETCCAASGDWPAPGSIHFCLHTVKKIYLPPWEW